MSKDRTAEIELFKRAKGGDNHALGQILKQYDRLVFKIALKFFKPSHRQFEDTCQELRLAIIGLVRGTYDPDKGAFTTYALRSLNHTAAVSVMYGRHPANGMNVHTAIHNEALWQEGYMYNDELRDGEIQHQEAVDVVIENHLVDDIMAAAQKAASCQAHYDMFQLCYSDGLTYADIGRRHGVSKQRVHQIITGILDTVRGEYGEDSRT